MTVTSPKFVVKIPEENITKKSNTPQSNARTWNSERFYVPTAAHRLLL